MLYAGECRRPVRLKQIEFSRFGISSMRYARVPLNSVVPELCERRREVSRARSTMHNASHGGGPSNQRNLETALTGHDTLDRDAWWADFVQRRAHALDHYSGERRPCPRHLRGSMMACSLLIPQVRHQRRGTAGSP